MRTMSQQRLPPSPIELPRRTGKKCCYSQKSWVVNMLQFCSVSNSPLTHNPFNKMRGIFSKKLCPPVVIVLNMFLYASVYEYATKVRPNKCPGYDIKQWRCTSSNAGALGNVEYPLHCHCSQVHTGSVG